MIAATVQRCGIAVLTALVFAAGCQSVAPPGAPAATPPAKIGGAAAATDLAPDPAVVYGQLENGLRYAVMRNALPSGTAALRMQIASGSINETDAQRGIAHFLEHMAFNGSKNVPEGEMTRRLERYGLAFGSDTNASTSFETTTYKLNLPNVSDAVVDEAFFLMRETASNLTLDADAIDRERGIIASEKRARDGVSYRSQVHYLEFLTRGSGLIERLPIGVEETIASMPRSEFVRYYEDFYHPEKTFIAFVGDLPPEAVIARIEKFFGDWKPAREPAPDRKLDAPEPLAGRVGYFHHPEVLTQVTLGVGRPYQKRPDTAARRKEDTIRRLGNSILNRRLRDLAAANDPRFMDATAAFFSSYRIVEGAQLRVRTTPENVSAAIGVAEQEIRRALEHGFTQSELEVAIAELHRQLRVSAERADTRPTTDQLGNGLIDQILGAHQQERVFTHPRTALELFESYKDELTPEVVWEAFRTAWVGFDEPYVYIATSAELGNVEALVASALEASRAVEVEPPADKQGAKFAYTDFGPPGKVVEERYLEDLDSHLIRFENNVLLNFKRTSWRKGIVQMVAHIGDGNLSAPRKDEGLRRLAYNLLALGGLEAHTENEVNSLMAGKQVSVAYRFYPWSETFELQGSSSVQDIADQFNLMAAYVKAPGYRTEAYETYIRRLKNWYPTWDSTPANALTKDLPRLLRSGDERFGFPDLEGFLEPTVEEAKAWLDPQIKHGLIQLVVVGDIDKETVVREVARTFGALPERAAAPGDYPEMRKLSFPPGMEKPVVIQHAGEKEQALLQIYWPAPEATDLKTRRELNVLRSAFRNALTAELREALGVTYSPGVGIEANPTFEGYGYLFATITVKPEDIETAQAAIEQVAAEMAAGRISQDQFDRAIRPLIEDLASSRENNGYWLNILADAQTGGRGIEEFRTETATYQSMKLADVRTLARRLFDAKAAIRVHCLPAALLAERN